MNKKKQFAKTTIIIFFGKVCTQLISFFLLPLYTAYLATCKKFTDKTQTIISIKIINLNGTCINEVIIKYKILNKNKLIHNI